MGRHLPPRYQHLLPGALEAQVQVCRPPASSASSPASRGLGPAGPSSSGGQVSSEATSPAAHRLPPFSSRLRSLGGGSTTPRPLASLPRSLGLQS